MNNSTLGIFIGGVLPTLVFGLSGLFLKTSGRSGLSLNYYLLFSGIGVLVVSLVCFPFFKEVVYNAKGSFFAALVGAFWAIGAVLMTVGISKFNIPIAVLAPIVAANSLVTVLLGFLVYSEWQNVNLYKLLAGAVLVIIGGVLVAQSS